MEEFQMFFLLMFFSACIVAIAIFVFKYIMSVCGESEPLDEDIEMLPKATSSNSASTGENLPCAPTLATETETRPNGNVFSISEGWLRGLSLPQEFSSSTSSSSDNPTPPTTTLVASAEEEDNDANSEAEQRRRGAIRRHTRVVSSVSLMQELDGIMNYYRSSRDANARANLPSYEELDHPLASSKYTDAPPDYLEAIQSGPIPKDVLPPPYTE